MSIIITDVEDKVLNNVQVLNHEGNWFYEGIFRNAVQSGLSRFSRDWETDQLFVLTKLVCPFRRSSRPP